MAWVTPSNVATGDVLTASTWNQDVVANAAELAPFFGAWTSWTPALTATSNPNTGSTGTALGHYIKVGRLVRFNAVIQTAGTGISGGTGDYRLSLPVAHKDSGSALVVVGNGFVFDGTFYTVAADRPTTTTMRLISSSGSAISSTHRQIVGSGWTLSISGAYEAAS